MDYDGYGHEEKEKEMVISGFPTLSQRSFPVDLVQNCDLPPPQKNIFLARQPRALSCTSGEEDEKFPMVEPSSEKLDLLKALQLSQTRARNAERKAKLAKQDTDSLTTLLLEESLRLFAYRQWVKILELELSQLQQHKKKQQQVPSWQSNDTRPDRVYQGGSSLDGDSGGDNQASCFTWYMTLALCFGIAGVGFAFGCRLF